MAKIEEPTIDVKLFVDKEKSRVLFAESDKDFVDMLFSFLTLPLGTIARVLGKQSQVECLDTVYKSVEGLGTDFFRTKACKTMLLRPISAAAKQCCQLKVRVDDTKHKEVYICRDTSCCSDSVYSSVPGAVCKCCEVMELAGERPEKDGGGCSGFGVFVKKCVTFIVTDDLQVAPTSTSLMLSLFDKFEVQDPSKLEQKILQLSSDKIISLLKRSLTSKQPLTGLYFDVAMAPEDSDKDILPENVHPEQGNDAEYTKDSVKIILHTKNNSSLLYAEVGDDFVDLLFGLLNIPLGSMMKRYGKCTPNGCVDNLYSSIDGSAKECIRPDCQIMVLSPKVAPFFGCSATNIAQVEELAPNKQTTNACFKCFRIGCFSDLGRCREQKSVWNGYDNIWQYKNCFESVKTTNLCEWDPKLPKEGCDKGEAYFKPGPQKFMVTDYLHVRPLTLSNTVQNVSEAKIQRKELVEKEFTFTKSQVMELLKSALVTRKALSSVLLPPNNEKKLHHYSSLLYLEPVP